MMWLGCIQSAGRLGRSLRRTAGVDGLGAAAQKTQTQGRDSGPDFKPSDAQQTGHRLVSGKTRLEFAIKRCSALLPAFYTSRD